MKTKQKKNKYVVFSPNLRADDELANYWMRQTTLRLRREVAWLWHERGLTAPQNEEQLPLYIDKLSVSLDLTRHWTDKQNFFKNDPTAKYFTEMLGLEPPSPKKIKRGSFGWLINELNLSDVSVFALALALTTAFDANMGSVIAACLNDANKIYPNLMLIQRLWDTPEEVLTLADPLHPLFCFGILRQTSGATRFYSENLWEEPLTVSSLIARQLFYKNDVVAENLKPLKVNQSDRTKLTETGKIIAYRLKGEKAKKLRIVPLIGAKGTNFGETIASVANITKREVLEFGGNAAILENEDYLNTLVLLCWLQDRDLFIKSEFFKKAEKETDRTEGLPHTSIPATVFCRISDHKQVQHIPRDFILPKIKIPPLSYEERVNVWQTELGKDAKKHKDIISEISRRFRYEKETIKEICRELKTLPNKLTKDDFIVACRAELNLDIGELAAAVTPRFSEEELILPHKQAVQFAEQIQAMRSLTKVHYEWGTAKVWNEGGITVLFAGPSGTGKTMGAEIMAHELDLPMYRIDLSQVVNKYIGETEKNLKRIFDAADVSDMVLFFDEADSLFGKRTEVNDSRDRYANLEVSYLLERMERFKGLGILATNRKKDLDAAFMRRLRYVIDFPMPEESQRRQIWQQVIPKGADKSANINTSDLDFNFLAKQFPLAGGNIRSIVFNACLQSAESQNGEKRLLMSDVLIAVKREYDKMNRSLSLEQFGKYAKEIAALEQK